MVFPASLVRRRRRAFDGFLRGQLRFAEAWRHADGGKILIAQVERESCEIIFSCQWPEKDGKGMLFISLDYDAFPVLPDELSSAGVAFARGNWGYRVVIVNDPDGNQLFFPDPSSSGG